MPNKTGYNNTDNPYDCSWCPHSKQVSSKGGRKIARATAEAIPLTNPGLDPPALTAPQFPVWYPSILSPGRYLPSSHHLRLLNVLPSAANLFPYPSASNAFQAFTMTSLFAALILRSGLAISLLTEVHRLIITTDRLTLKVFDITRYLTRKSFYIYRQDILSDLITHIQW